MSSFPSLSSFKGKKIALIPHRGADVDAIASAAVLQLFLKKYSSVEIIVPEHLNQSAKKLSKEFRIRYKISGSLKKFDTLFLLDLNSWKMLGLLASEVKNFLGNVFVIDHHSKTGDNIAPANHTLIEEKAVSLTEMLFKLFKKQKIPLTEKQNALLAAGLIADSAHFIHANAESFEIMHELLKKSSHSYEALLQILFIEKDISEKIAKLKAARRVRIFKLGDFIVATTDVGAFEAEVAQTLIEIGADIAFVASELKKDDSVVISSRASYKVRKKTGFDLAKDVFLLLEELFEGEGGGHPGAAAFNGKGSMQEMLQKCLELTQKKLGTEIKEYT